MNKVVLALNLDAVQVSDEGQINVLSAGYQKENKQTLLLHRK